MIENEYLFSIKVFPNDKSLHVFRHMGDGLGLAVIVEFTTLKQGILDAGKLIREAIEDDAIPRILTP
jgi:hypothetical protein